MANEKSNSKYIYIGVIVALVVILGFVFISNQQKSSNQPANSNNYNPPPSTGNVVNNPPAQNTQNSQSGISPEEAKKIAEDQLINDRIRFNYIAAGCEDYSIKRDWDLTTQFEKNGVYYFRYKVSVDCTIPYHDIGPWHKDGIEEICVSKDSGNLVNC